MKDIFTELASVFQYPTDAYLSRIRQTAEKLGASNRAAAARLKQFVQNIEEMTPGELQELYTSTFDLTPACAPYISVHLFGEGNFKRSKLMTGLAETYASLGVACDGELPDHLSQLLSAFDRFPVDLRHDLAKLCLAPALTKMHEILERLNNPYTHAVLAVQGCLNSIESSAEACHA